MAENIKFLKSKYQHTVPKMPEQNGVAERLNRILMETVCSMASLPQAFWAEALFIATYLKNVAHAQVMEGMTPYEAWKQVKPKVDHLCIF